MANLLAATAMFTGCEAANSGSGAAGPRIGLPIRKGEPRAECRACPDWLSAGPRC
jgi:hypothetical protein